MLHVRLLLCPHEPPHPQTHTFSALFVLGKQPGSPHAHAERPQRQPRSLLPRRAPGTQSRGSTGLRRVRDAGHSHTGSPRPQQGRARHRELGLTAAAKTHIHPGNRARCEYDSAQLE